MMKMAPLPTPVMMSISLGDGLEGADSDLQRRRGISPPPLSQKIM
jgi:hypothetical protein